MKNKYYIIFFFLLLAPLAVMAKSKKTIWVIDAGHGGRDVGCEGTKAKEKDINLKIALRVAELVRANISGVKVVMTRDTDKYLTLDERCTVANNAGADLFLSIHVNAAPDASSVRGTETYYGPMGATANANVEAARKRYLQKSELLAWEMQKNYGLAGRPISRGVKRERYYVILHTLMPSVLTEIGFISTASEQEYMTSKSGQEEIAQCIYKGLRDYKKTVDNGQEKKVLAEMRNTGGRVSGTRNAKDDAAVDLAMNDEDTSNTDDTNGQRGKNAKNSNGKNLASSAKASVSSKKNSASGKDNAAEPDPSLEPELDSGELTFAVQIMWGTNKLPANDRSFKGLKNVTMKGNDGKYKYFYGTTSDYSAVRKTLAEVRKIFPDAFLVAFLGQRQISTSDALELYVKKK